MGLAMAVLVLAGVVSGANVYGAFTFGDTSITSSSCSADAYGTIPSQLDINNGDNVLIDFNISWSDTRSSPANSATHHFNITVSYPHRANQWQDFSTLTSGGSFGGNQYQKVITNVLAGDTITVALLVQVTSADCSPNTVTDTASGTITLT
jgi:hypothetical protein